MTASKPLRILLVEDEFITRDHLRESLETVGYIISGEAATAREALRILDRQDVDLAIIDITLEEDETGIWLARHIRRDYGIPFVFLTASGDTDTISAAAGTAPAAYLLKPFSLPDLFAALELSLHQSDDSPVPAGTTPLGIRDSIFVKDQLIYRRLAITDISHVQSFRNYLEIHVGKERYVVRSSLKDFMARLPESHFIRAHRSFVINMHKVTEFGATHACVDGEEIPIGRTLRAEVLARLRTLHA